MKIRSLITIIRKKIFGTNIEIQSDQIGSEENKVFELTQQDSARFTEAKKEKIANIEIADRLVEEPSGIHTITKTEIGKRKINAIVRSELNLEQNNIFTVSTYREKSREITSKEIMPTGEITERKITIGKTADGLETGILTTHHFKVYLSLVELWEKAGKPTNEPVHFTTLKIIKRLEMRDSGEDYNHLKRWLRNLRQVPITFMNSFYIPGTSEHVDLADVTILNHLHIYERKRVGRQNKTRGYGEFRFDDHILENLINNHTHPLRLDIINSFTKHRDLAILLYTYIDRNIAFKDKYEIGLEKLFEHLDLSQNHVKYPSDRKRVLDPVLEQLKSKELSTGILSYAEILKTADGKDYKLVCRKKPFTKELKDQPEQLTLPIGIEIDESEIPESPEPCSELFSLLIEKGLTGKQAGRIISEKEPEVIKTQVEYLPYRIEEYKSQNKEINEPAILYDSIIDNWNTPKGYIEIGKIKEREARKLEAERIAFEEREAWNRSEQDREKIKAYKESLNHGDRTKLRERALERIRAMKGIKDDFITELLIDSQENEILREDVNEK